MVRGLLWLPLLVVFVWLAWAGWNEYQKLESYKTWAQQFDHAKYDIYAVLGQKGGELTWGKPTRKGPVELRSLSLSEVNQIQVVVGDRPIDPNQLPQKSNRVALELQLATTTIRIPFTELPLAIQWGKHLQDDWQQLKQAS